MELKHRDCGIKMRLVPYGAGWTDLYADFGDGEIYFIISNVMCSGFETLMRALYYLHPSNSCAGHDSDIIDYKYGICEKVDNEYIVKQIVEDTHDYEPPSVYRVIPWKAHFEWDEEGSCSKWLFEREPTEEDNFMIKLHIEHERSKTKIYDYQLRYEDICYAVADACTKALKKHGFNGYHAATYEEDVNVRYLLFLKAVGLGCMEACETTWYKEKGKGDTSDFSKEMELLLFDM
jgi:hypothetical protein